MTSPKDHPPKDTVFGYYKKEGERFKLWKKDEKEWMSASANRIEDMMPVPGQQGVWRITLDTNGDYVKDLEFGASTRSFVRQVKAGDGWRDKLVKLIPAEIVAAYLALQAYLIDLGAGVVIGAIVLLLVFTFAYLRRAGVKNNLQLLFSCASFLIWVYSIAPVELLQGLYNPPLASVILGLWTLGIPFVPTDSLR